MKLMAAFAMFAGVCTLSSGIWAQSKISLMNSKPLDPERYKEIKGSPYMFDEWVKGDVLPSSGDPILGADINYNGYTSNFEIRQDNRFIELITGNIIGIRITEPMGSCEKMIFVKYAHPKMHAVYPLFIYHGQKYKLIKDFRITLVEKKVESPGKTVKFKTFNDVHSYYLQNDQEVDLIRLNRKTFVDRFGASVEKYIKEYDLDLSTESGACLLLSLLEKDNSD